MLLWLKRQLGLAFKGRQNIIFSRDEAFLKPRIRTIIFLQDCRIQESSPTRLRVPVAKLKGSILESLVNHWRPNILSRKPQSDLRMQSHSPSSWLLVRAAFTVHHGHQERRRIIQRGTSRESSQQGDTNEDVQRLHKS